MTLPPLPDWLPDWAFLLLAVPVLLYALLFLLMPFSVFGVKSRLEALESQIVLLHDEIRVLGVRETPTAPRPVSTAFEEDIPDFGRLKQRIAAEPSPAPPPTQPPATPPLSAMRDRPYLNELRAAGRRVEPRLE
jgi:hypothetical protein